MKHWKEEKFNTSPTIIMQPKVDYGIQVMGVSNNKGKIEFFEASDRVYSIELDKQQALELVEELKQWIEKQ